MKDCVDCPKPECDLEVKDDEIRNLTEEEEAKAKARWAVARKFPRPRGLNRTIGYVFAIGKSLYFRVNFFEESKEQYVMSHFLEVRDGKVFKFPSGEEVE